MIQMNLLTKQNKTHRLRKQTYGCHKEKRIVREFGMVMYTLLYFKWITNKDLLYSTWNSAQHYLDGRGTGGEWIHAHVCLSPSLFNWNYHNIVNRLYLSTKPKVQNKKKNLSCKTFVLTCVCLAINYFWLFYFSKTPIMILHCWHLFHFSICL